jgi:lipoate-protein ligase B
LGLVDYQRALALQQRLVFEAGGRNDGQIALLLCEHPATISIGRQGSRGDIRASGRSLASRGLGVHWVNRGGGTIVHGPGQLAVYPIVPLAWHEWSVGQYMDRLPRALLSLMTELHLNVVPRACRYGVWGRAGQVVAVGAAVKNWTTYHGAYINVSASSYLSRVAECDPLERTTMTSLVADKQQPVKMTAVREGIVRHLAAEFDCSRYHLHTGHALLNTTYRADHAPAARAS